MEGLVAVPGSGFWRNRRVFVTGHSGFKGGWLCLMLRGLGARVTGYAQKPPTDPSLFDTCKIGSLAKTVVGDVRDLRNLRKSMVKASPEVVIHMAAQAIVRDSYIDPVGTYETNVMGTVNLLEALRGCSTVRAVIIVTSDKCYENREWIWGYREQEPLGGYDPYSSSKACAEMVTAAYRNSFFNPAAYRDHRAAVASVRAGNVIGGGDWARDRIIPDCIRAVMKKKRVELRNPGAVRPWQHVLEPLTGYLMLAERLHREGPLFGAAWNFGPRNEDVRPVSWIAESVSRRFDASVALQKKGVRPKPHEAATLRLDSTRAMDILGWKPRWDIGTAVDKTVSWYQAYLSGRDMRKISEQQIEEYLSGAWGHE